MGCFTCQKGFSGTENDIINYYKRLYKEKGYLTYVYRVSEKGAIQIASKSSFLAIFDTIIKPNYDKGANYARIDEFRQD